MDPIEDALREAFLPAFFGGEEVSANLREILGHSVKRGVLGIPKPWLLADCAYNTYKSDSKVLVGLLLRETDLKYRAHKGWGGEGLEEEGRKARAGGANDTSEEVGYPEQRGGVEDPPLL